MEEAKIEQAKKEALITPDAEKILHKYGVVGKIIGCISLALGILFCIINIARVDIYMDSNYLFDAFESVIIGVLGFFASIVLKAFIDVYVNISVTLRGMDASKED